jgi:putative tryptophan/tyrosine transport system substrate-binding protein
VRLRRGVIQFSLAAILLSLSFSVEAQQKENVPRIGFLDPSIASGSAVLMEVFRQEMRKLGWIEGKNFTIEYRLQSINESAWLSLRPSWCVLMLI